MDNGRLKLIIFSIIFLGLSCLTFFVFKPFLSILVLAVVLSVLFQPLNKKLVKILGGSKSFVACLLVIVTLIFLVIPLLFFGSQVLGQAQNFFSLTHVGQGRYLQTIQQHADSLIRHFIPTFSFSIGDPISKILTFVSDNLGGLLSQSAYIFFQTFFLLFTLFFFLRDGERMLDSLISLSPFTKEQNKEIIDSVHITITSVMRGTLLVGLIRFVLLAITFYIFGIPGALLWASIGGIIGAIPGLGTPFVVIPAFLYLLLYGNIFWAICMGLLGILLIFFIDNLLSAYFFGKGFDVPSIFVLFSILGGIFLFGPLGFIFGPIIFSLFISAVDMYKILVLKKL